MNPTPFELPDVTKWLKKKYLVIYWKKNVHQMVRAVMVNLVDNALGSFSLFSYRNVSLKLHFTTMRWCHFRVRRLSISLLVCNLLQFPAPDALFQPCLAYGKTFHIDGSWYFLQFLFFLKKKLFPIFKHLFPPPPFFLRDTIKSSHQGALSGKHAGMLQK